MVVIIRFCLCVCSWACWWTGRSRTARKPRITWSTRCTGKPRTTRCSRTFRWRWSRGRYWSSR